MEIREKMAQLCGKINGISIPKQDVDWYDTFSGYGVEETKYFTLEKILKRCAALLSQGVKEGIDEVEWLAQLYDLGMVEQDTSREISAGAVEMFPNQNADDLSDCKLYTIKEIYKDPGIPEILKDASEQLDKLESYGELKIRNRLLHTSFAPKMALAVADYPLSNFSEYIIQRSNRGFRVTNFYIYSNSYLNAWYGAWKRLLSSGEDQDMYELAKILWSDLPEYVPCGEEIFPKRMWNNTACGVLELLIDFVEKQETLEALSRKVNAKASQEETISWLEKLYRRVNQYLNSFNYDTRRMIPNQEGTLKSLSGLKKDQIGDEKLKQIAFYLREENSDCDVKQVLADQRLNLNEWRMTTMSVQDVASYINSALHQILSDTNLSETSQEVQSACTQLLNWIRNHLELARQLFPTFSKDDEAQMKLLTPGSAAQLQREADQLERLMEEAGVSDPEEILKWIKKQKAQAEGIVSREAEDPTWDGLSALERMERIRKIGTAGEKCVFRMIGAHYKQLGYTPETENENLAVYSSEDGIYRIVVEYPETEEYHQSGWDILLRIQQGKKEEVYQLEVKTHTTTSKVRSNLELTDAQMRQAAKLGDHYIVVRVIYNEWTEMAEDVSCFQNVIEYLAQGTLVNNNEERRYILRSIGR